MDDHSQKKEEFLYPRGKYYGEFSLENLVFDAKELFKNKFGLFELIIESPPLSVGLLRPNLFLNRP